MSSNDCACSAPPALAPEESALRSARRQEGVSGRSAGTPSAPSARTSPLTPGVIVALLAVYLIWGSTYLAIRVVVTHGVPPLLGMGVRFLVAGLLLGAALRLRRGAGALRISRPQLVTAAVVG